MGAYGDRMNLEARVNAVLERALEERRIVGGVLRVARDGELILHRAVGLAGREAQTPMTESTSFRFASLTKPIVTVAALGLIERGALSLDDEASFRGPKFMRPSASGSTEVTPVG